MWMSVDPVSILGGESVYCINEGQLSDAMRLANEDETSSPRIQATLADLEKNLTRNERAALAFVIIERLRDLNN
ncbi:MAG: hypothetical protein ACI9OU_002290 [Candidatus Promineifilaceae bacterium]|jgi:hypothetical protein